MPSGGHARSGPPKDPNSGRSARLGVAFSELPAAGYDGEVPQFPLPRPTRREVALWVWVWGTPQACVWARESWRWHSVAMWVRTAALCETAKASSADKSSMQRFADDIGLSSAGLARNGWKIAAKIEPAEVPAQRPASSRDRFEVIDGGA